ncbi:hypothetical protein STEG23_022950 [Scotinomys teguina]
MELASSFDDGTQQGINSDRILEITRNPQLPDSHCCSTVQNAMIQVTCIAMITLFFDHLDQSLLFIEKGPKPQKRD